MRIPEVALANLGLRKYRNILFHQEENWDFSPSKVPGFSNRIPPLVLSEASREVELDMVGDVGAEESEEIMGIGSRGVPKSKSRVICKNVSKAK